jgi:tetratricopeptide (TPR) repeat protein
MCKQFIERILFLGCAILATGCQDWNRRSMPPTDLGEPPEKVQERLKSEDADVAGSVEDMLRSRVAYLEQLKRLEKLYLELGDLSRANWARRQRERTEAVELYPYLSNRPSQSTPEVSPEEKIPEADALYEKAKAKLNEVRGVPLAGFLEPNREKARQALAMFQELLRKYPKSDKVDDAAFYCGEIYKEYLRKEDPDDELSIKYYEWAWELDPKTPHAARFQCAVVEDFRRHNRKRALELYREVLIDEADLHPSNCRFAASRIEQLTDEEGSHLRPREEKEPSGGELRTEIPVSPATAGPAALPKPDRANAPDAEVESADETAAPDEETSSEP